MMTKSLESTSEDQSAALRISDIVPPDHTALELAAPLTEWALRTLVSIPTSCKHVLSHLAIVLLKTKSGFLIHDRYKALLGFTESKAQNFRVLHWYSCSVTTGHMLGYPG